MADPAAAALRALLAHLPPEALRDALHAAVDAAVDAVETSPRRVRTRPAFVPCEPVNEVAADDARRALARHGVG
jgi:hypothetical protein